MSEEASAIDGIRSALEQTHSGLGAATDRLEDRRGYGKARRKIQQAYNKVADAIILLADAEDLVRDRKD